MKSLVPLLSVPLVYLVIKLYCKNWLPLLRQGFLNLAQSGEKWNTCCHVNKQGHDSHQ